MHGSLCDRFNTIPPQCPRSLCETLAKQFLARDSWHSALGILQHLHPDNDERPRDPSASSWDRPIGLDAAQSVMEIDHVVEAAPSVPPVVEASPTASERRGITNWLLKIHRQIRHRDNRKLVRLLKQRGTHPWLLKMAHEHRCSSCEAAVKFERHIKPRIELPEERKLFVSSQLQSFREQVQQHVNDHGAEGIGAHTVLF